jgi:HEAT repeat protein
VLIRALADPSEEVRCLAARWLAELGPDAADAAPALARILKRRSTSELPLLAARALCALGPKAKPATMVLYRALLDRNARIRVAAAGALLQIEPGCPEALAALAAARNDPEAEVREEAEAVLRRVGKETVSRRKDP